MHFKCPLCGKYSVVEKYNPQTHSWIEEEYIWIEIPFVEFKGLGRGKGFQKIEIKDPPSQTWLDLHYYLAKRTQEIMKYFDEKGIPYQI